MMLNRNKKHNTNRQLVPLSRVPTMSDLQELVSVVTSQPGQTFELPVRLTDNFFALALSSRRRTRDACLSWCLFRGDNFETRVQLWTYETQDLAIMHNIILCSIDEHNSGALEKLDTYAAKSTAPISQALTAPIASSESSSSAKSSESLYGNLANFPIDGILQSLSTNNSTGLLTLLNRGIEARVWLKDGKLIHSVLDNIQGETAALEVFLWHEGTFQYAPDVPAPAETITRSLPGLLMQSATLADYCEFLSRNSVTLDNYLLACPASPAEYSARLDGTVPVNENQQRAVYDSLSAQAHKVSDIICTFSMTRAEWAPVLFNLTKTGLVKVVGSPGVEAPPAVLTTRIDWPDLSGLQKELIRPDTGIYSFAAFVCFLELEITRFSTFNRPFSLILMSIVDTTSFAANSLSSEQETEVALRIFRIKRGCDLLCHFENSKHALILPEVTEQSCAFIINRIREVILSRPLTQDSDPSKLSIAFGSATASPAVKTKETLVSTALERLSLRSAR